MIELMIICLYLGLFQKNARFLGSEAESFLFISLPQHQPLHVVHSNPSIKTEQVYIVIDHLSTGKEKVEERILL